MDFDVLVLGTGLSQSITAASLSKAGFKVAHVDANQYYGSDNASLSLSELLEWAHERSASLEEDPSPYLSAQRTRFSSITHSGDILAQSRLYAISLTPTIIPSIGPLIDSLIASGVSRYGGFKLLERIAIFSEPGKVKTVPSSKEDVFKDKSISLLDKRRLMRFLMFAGGDFEGKPELAGHEQTPLLVFLKEKFSLNDETAQAITYALAFCNSPLDPTLPALNRIRRYLRSTGRYGPSSFLVGHYGGVGEIAQGFCRASAVGGATYVLGRKMLNITQSAPGSSRKYVASLEGVDEEVFADLISAEPDYLCGTNLVNPAPQQHRPLSSMARCIAIIDCPLSLPSDASHEIKRAPEEDEENPLSEESEDKGIVDTALLVFPPSSIVGCSVATSATVLVTGEGTISTPSDKWILYITIPLLEVPTKSAEEILRPYLTATLTLTSPKLDEPLFSAFYFEQSLNLPVSTTESCPSILLSEPYSSLLPEIADSAASNGELAFWKAVELLKELGRKPQPKVSEGNVGEGGLGGEVTSFWPPLDYVDDGEDW